MRAHTAATWAMEDDPAALFNAALAAGVAHARLVLAAVACARLALVHLPPNNGGARRTIKTAAACARGAATHADLIATLAHGHGGDAVFDSAAYVAVLVGTTARTRAATLFEKVVVDVGEYAETAALRMLDQSLPEIGYAAYDEARRRMAGRVREHIPWSTLAAGART